MLLQIPQVLNAEELAQVKSLLADADWVDGRVTAGRQAATVKNNQQLPEQAAQMAALRKIVLTA